MTKRLALLLASLFWSTSSAHLNKGYKIVSSRELKSDKPALKKAENVSYDGSLNDLFDQAMVNAESSAPVPMISDLATSPPTSTLSPVTSATITSAPTTSAPVSQAPITQSPVSVAPITAAPITSTPTESPTTIAPTFFPSIPPSVSPVQGTTVPVVVATAVPATGAPMNTTTSPVASLPQVAPSSAISTVIDCPNSSFESVDAITYRFAMEYESDREVNVVIAALEKDMNEHLVAALMPCTGSKRRSLQEEIGIVALDSRPEDTVATTAFCGATFDTNLCHVIDGQMRVFLAQGVLADAVNYKVRVAIRSYLNSIQDVPGVYATTYLSPEIINPSEVSGVAESGAPIFTSTSTNEDLSIRSIVLFSFAGIAFIGSVGIAIWFRRNHERRHNSLAQVIKDDPPPIALVDTIDTNSIGENDSLSPFSKMLPAAYRLDNGNDDMSVILELGESSSRNGSSIMISEGYSSDSEKSEMSDLNISRYSYTQAPTLGATKRAEDDDSITDF